MAIVRNNKAKMKKKKSQLSILKISFTLKLFYLCAGSPERLRLVSCGESVFFFYTFCQMSPWFQNVCVKQIHVECAPVFQYVDDNLAVMSIGFLLSSPDDAVIWRGPKKNGADVVPLWIS